VEEADRQWRGWVVASGGDPRRVVEARGIGGLAGERWRRAVIGDLLVRQQLTGVGARGASLAGGSSSKAALHEGEVEVVLLLAFDDDVGAGGDRRRSTTEAESRATRRESEEAKCGGNSPPSPCSRG
jgi:hypothetical protein